jgi:hypothetical protein
MVEILHSFAGIEAQGCLKTGGSPNQWAELMRTREIVVDSPSPIADRSRAGQVGQWIQGIDVVAFGQVRNIERLSSKPLVKEASSSSILATGLLPAPDFKWCGSRSSKQSGKKFEVDFLVLETKGKVSCKIIRW